MNITLEGKTAFITGAARGQGRQHAITLAQAGANIVASDICQQIDTVPYSMATRDDLDETVALVEETGQKIVALQADVRELSQLRHAVDQGLVSFGSLDIVCANAGIYSFGPIDSYDIEPQRWNDVISTDLTGVFNTIKTTAPAMIDGGRGGSIIVTSSTAGLRGLRSMADYTAAKHGVVGLTRAFANELAQHRIRVNSIHPTGVDTHMVTNPELAEFYAQFPDMADNVSGNLLPVELVEAQDISNAVVFLASDATRYVTGLQMTVDAGFTTKV